MTNHNVAQRDEQLVERHWYRQRRDERNHQNFDDL